MFFGRSKKTDDPMQERIDCLIGSDASITGDVIFTGGLRIDGNIKGDVTVSNINPGTLMIGDQGCIEGVVRVSHLIVFGEIKGTVYATGLVDMRSKCRISGDVHYGELEVQAGAVIEGNLVKQKSAGAPQ